MTIIEQAQAYVNSLDNVDKDEYYETAAERAASVLDAFLAMTGNPTYVVRTRVVHNSKSVTVSEMPFVLLGLAELYYADQVRVFDQSSHKSVSVSLLSTDGADMSVWRKP